MTDVLRQFCSTPLFGLVVTLAAYTAGRLLYSRFPVSILHPVLTASALIITLLTLMDIRLEDYQLGGRFISFMLGPATVSLALPLYRKMALLRKHFFIILASISAGAVSSIVSAILLSKLFDLPGELLLALVPKSVTTPIAVEIAEQLGGMTSLTAIAVIMTGIIVAITGPPILKILKIDSPTARGLALGTAGHAIGTSRAIETGQTEGAVASLSIGLAGIITVIAAPLIVNLLF